MIDAVVQIPEFIWVILGNFLGVPLGVLIAHLLSRKSRLYELKLNTVFQLSREFNTYRMDEGYSYTNLLHCLNDATFIFTSEKIRSDIENFFRENRDKAVVGRIYLDRIPRILKLMYEDIDPKFMKRKPVPRPS